MNNAYWRLLAHRPSFRYLWLAQVVSLLGDWFNTIATIVLVNRYSGSGLAVSALFLARGLPPFLMGPLVGVVADRFNRKVIMIVSDLLRMVIVLGLLLVNSSDRLWLLYVLTTLQFMASAFFEPARAAILPSIVDRGTELLTANTLSSATWSAVLAFGAAIGGITAAQFGVGIALVIDALTFLLSAFLIARIADSGRVLREGAKSSGWMDMVDGFRYVMQRPRVGVFVLVKGLAQIGSVDTMFALYAGSIFVVGRDGAITLGILYTMFGIGAVIGPVVGNSLSDGSQLALRRWVWIGFLLSMLGWLGYGVSPVLILAASSILVRGMGGSINWTYSNVLLQLNVPDRYLGRVFALDFSVFTLCYALSVFATGLFTDTLRVDPRLLAAWFGVASVVPVMFWKWVLRWQAKPTSASTD
ncbi:MAG: MFS transporter [Anaerolineales bacterium]|nr:MFS transporter [Anaerolineales bacterium]